MRSRSSASAMENGSNPNDRAKRRGNAMTGPHWAHESARERQKPRGCGASERWAILGSNQ
jgi:hypothetical protein